MPPLPAPPLACCVRRWASSVPSRHMRNPPLMDSPQPVPPPLWMETLVAPRHASPMTFWIAISAVNLDPSSMLDVSLVNIHCEHRHAPSKGAQDHVGCGCF